MSSFALINQKYLFQICSQLLLIYYEKLLVKKKHEVDLLA